MLQRKEEHGVRLVGVLCDDGNKLLWLCLLRVLWELEWTDPETGVSLLVLDRLFVTLSPLFLDDELHLSLRVFDHGSSNFDHVGREMRRPSEGEFA